MKLMVGDRVARLLLLEDRGVSSGHREWWCRCECGTECSARQDKLRSGRVQSCGCLRVEMASALHRTALARHLKKLDLRVQRMAAGRARKRLCDDLEVKDYQHFKESGSPAKVAEMFEAWAFTVAGVLKDGPDTDVVTIETKVDVSKPTPASQI